MRSAKLVCITRALANDSPPFEAIASMQSSAAAFAQHDVQWTPWFRTQPWRCAPIDSGSTSTRWPSGQQRIAGGWVSSVPKLSVVLGPWRRSEVYLSAGTGFHSNDARGVTHDRRSRLAASRPIACQPLTRARGAELGFRSLPMPWAPGHRGRLDAQPRFGARVRRRCRHDRSRPSKPTRRTVELSTLYRGCAPGCRSTQTSPGHARDSPMSIRPGGQHPWRAGARDRSRADRSRARPRRRQPEAAPLRTSCPHRGRRRSLARHDDRERPDRACHQPVAHGSCSTVSTSSTRRSAISNTSTPHGFLASRLPASRMSTRHPALPRSLRLDCRSGFSSDPSGKK